MTSNQDLATLVSSAKEAKGYSYDSFAKACGGVPARQRLFQLINDPLKNFPDPATIKGLARGTGYTVTEIIMASARSLGLDVSDTEPDSVYVAGLHTLPASTREAFLQLGREIGVLATNQEPHVEAIPEIEPPTDIGSAGKRRDARPGQKTGSRAPDDGNIPLPDNWQDLAAGAPHESQVRRDREWTERGEESQDQGE
ncbi:hypothetical protein LN996_22665 [Arthrobacter sp. AK01]|uniref:hypothetical protein n=1 Tax=Micrococcaceae TaxID=1268 RepID=UPI001E3D719C|nr:MULTISPECIES: hypothetical protein [Micrococcaceae]MCD4853628.1 hypothetical protein [Arthrobacter sp. AK01]MCP1414870.1 hypothetical protein [Paenarthrobacter sp. A20]